MPVEVPSLIQNIMILWILFFGFLISLIFLEVN